MTAGGLLVHKVIINQYFSNLINIQLLNTISGIEKPTTCIFIVKLRLICSFVHVRLFVFHSKHDETLCYRITFSNIITDTI